MTDTFYFICTQRAHASRKAWRDRSKWRPFFCSILSSTFKWCERVGNHSVYIIQPLLDETHPNCDKERLGHPVQSITNMSTRRKDAKLSVDTFTSAFPFHVMFSRQLLIKQLGDTIMRMMATALAADGLNLNSYFKVLSPPLEKVTFESILANINLCYVITTTCVLSGLSSTESKYSVSFI